MSITQNGRDNLGTYYTRKPDPVLPCEKSDKTKWWLFTPYDAKETWYWILRMLVLPGGIAAILIFLVLFQFYNNIFVQLISFGLTYVGSLLLIIFYWERDRTTRFKIPDDELIPEGKKTLNKIKDPKVWIGFVGDIMKMRKFKLEFDPPVKKFFEKIPFIVGNLEGIIPKQKGLLKQSHPVGILKELEGVLKTNTRWLLCVSNNHSIDYGNNDFFESVKIIQEHENEQNHNKNFDAFGRNDVPKVFVDNNICLSSATEWSNQKTWKCTSKFDTTKLDCYFCANKFNILYPHWGYENERYVRTNIKNRAEELLKKWDLIFAHHPHVRQPVMEVKGDKLKKQDGTPVLNQDGSEATLNKLVAFSGGNFTSGVTFIRKKKHIHGIIMKCEIGPLEHDVTQLAVGEVEWYNTFNKKKAPKTKLVMKGVGIAGRSRTYYIVLGILVLLTAVFLYFFELFF